MSPVELALFGVTVAIVAVALIAGRTPERLSAALFATATIATQIVSLFIPMWKAGNILLAIDGIMALGYLFLAIRYGYLWIALMMGAMAGYFAIHAYYLAMFRPLDKMFAVSSNVATAVVLLSLAIGVWSARRRPAEP